MGRPTGTSAATHLLIRDTHGALGSRLHKAKDGTWVAYAQWPSAEHRENARLRPSVNAPAFARMRTCIEQTFDESVFEVTDDLLEHTVTRE